ncbi:MAG TPA: hypothetical protein VGC15_16745 [Acetobacteraceae bacterium]
MMRGILMAAAMGMALASPVMAQGVDVGRLLQQGGILPRQQGPDPREQADRDRAIYEQGRRDEEARREDARRHRESERAEDRRLGGHRTDDRDDRRRGDPRGYDDRRRVEQDRFRPDQDSGPPRY